MGRRPRLTLKDLRADWVYVGAGAAAILADVSHQTLERWVAAGELVPVRLPRGGRAGRSRLLYRLEDVLALRDGRKG